MIYFSLFCDRDKCLSIDSMPMAAFAIKLMCPSCDTSRAIVHALTLWNAKWHTSSWFVVFVYYNIHVYKYVRTDSASGVAYVRTDCVASNPGQSEEWDLSVVWLEPFVYSHRFLPMSPVLILCLIEHCQCVVFIIPCKPWLALADNFLSGKHKTLDHSGWCSIDRRSLNMDWTHECVGSWIREL